MLSRSKLRSVGRLSRPYGIQRRWLTPAGVNPGLTRTRISIQNRSEGPLAGSAIHQREFKLAATILIAEDDAALRSFIASILAEESYTVLSACDGAEALLLAGRCESDIDVLITDFEMPDINGLAVAAAISRVFPAIGVVLMSGLHGQEIPSSTMDFVFLKKPFTAAALREALVTTFRQPHARRRSSLETQSGTSPE